MFEDVTVEPFRGDWEGLQTMAHSSWRDEYGIESFPDLYRPEFMRFLFGRLKENDHLIAAYQGEELVSFLVNLPQTFSLRGQVYRAAYSCLLVTRKKLLRKGLGTAIVQEALKLNKRYKYDFALFTLETGHRSTLMINKLKEAGSPVEHVKKVYVIARILNLDQAAYSEGLKTWERAAVKLIGGHRPPIPNPGVILREYQNSDLDDCLLLLNRYQQTADLALVWSREDLAQELTWPDVSQTLVFERGGRVQGLINFIYHDHMAKTKERWAWINHVAYPDLTPQEQRAFVQSYLEYIKSQGCLGTVEWTRGYYSLLPFFRSRFFPYFRAVNMVSWTFNPEISLRNLSKVYEIQV
jgi:hypothetical protein